MTTDESGAPGGQDARGLGALTHQSNRTTGGAERMASGMLNFADALLASDRRLLALIRDLRASLNALWVIVAIDTAALVLVTGKVAHAW